MSNETPSVIDMSKEKNNTGIGIVIFIIFLVIGFLGLMYFVNKYIVLNPNGSGLSFTWTLEEEKPEPVKDIVISEEEIDDTMYYTKVRTNDGCEVGLYFEIYPYPDLDKIQYAKLRNEIMKYCSEVDVLYTHNNRNEFIEGLSKLIFDVVDIYGKKVQAIEIVNVEYEMRVQSMINEVLKRKNMLEHAKAEKQRLKLEAEMVEIKAEAERKKLELERELRLYEAETKAKEILILKHAEAEAEKFKGK